MIKLSYIVLSSLQKALSFLKSAILPQSCHMYFQEFLSYKQIFPLNSPNSCIKWHAALLRFVRKCKRNDLPAVSRDIHVQ